MLLSGTLAGVLHAQQTELREEIDFARTEFEKGRYKQAAELLSDLLEDDPSLTDAMVLLLRIEMERGEFGRAEELDAALAALPAAPENGEGTAAPVDVLLARADYAFARGRTADSETLARTALEDRPKDLYACFVVARALMERGARSEAREWVEQSMAGVDQRGLDSDGLLNAGRLHRVVGEWKAAAPFCVYAERRRIEEGRPTTDVLLELGDLYRLAKTLDNRLPRAFSTYRDALKTNESLVAAKVGRALVHLYVNDSFDAEREIDEALAINPHSVDALRVKAWFLVLDGRHSEALELIDRATAVNPAAKQALATRAAALYLLNRTEEYQALVERVLELDPTFGQLFLTVGDALSRHLRFADSVPFHRKAIELDPELAMAYISLGRDLCFTGAEQEGREALLRSLELHPFKHLWRSNMLQILKKLDREFVDTESGQYRFRIHVDENPILAPRLIEAFQEDRKSLEERYQWSPSDAILVEMLPDHDDFSVRSVGFAGLGAVGACFGSLVTLISPRSELRGGFVWRRTALHELAHVFSLGRSRGRVPRWLTEGLSVYEERRASPTWNRDQEMELIQAHANDALMPLREFNSFFRGPRIGFAYYQGGLWVEFVVKRHGFDKILEMLDAYAEDLETPQVVQQVFGRTPEEMDRDFERYLVDHKIKGRSVQASYGTKKRGELRRELRKDPENSDLLSEVAWAYYQAGRLVDADAFLGRALERDPSHPVALRLAARRAYDHQRLDLARENLEAAFKNGEPEYGSALLLARICREQKDVAGAQAALEVALSSFPEEVGPGNPYLELYQLKKEEGETAEAMRYLERYVKRAEASVRPRIDLATWWLREGRHDDAYEVLKQAEEADPFVREVYLLQAEALRGAGRLAEAVDALRSALLVDPRMEPGYTPQPSGAVVPSGDAGGGDGMGDEDAARADILVTIAEIEHEAGDDAAARRDLERARQLDPDSERVGDLLKELDN